MRITFVLPCFNLSGGIRVAAIYAERLHRRGHRVVAIAPCERGPTFRDVVRSLIKERKWPSAPLPEPSHFDGMAVGHVLLPHPAPVIEADVPDADVIVATWWESAEWVAKMSDVKGVKVHFMQGYEVFAGNPEEVDSTYRRPIGKIVISGWLRDIVQGKFGQTPLALIPNSVDMGQFHAPPRGKQATPTVGFSYTTQAIKGCDIILKAYDLAAERIPGLRLVVIGNCPVSDRLPLPPGAEFCYQARDQTLRGAYSRCDVWLSGTREEGFGLPILEAMACRTPVIATPAGAAPELLAKGGGVLVPHEDAGAMAGAIADICLLHEDRWRVLSDAALATATGYTWDDATDLFEKALQVAVERSRDPARSSTPV